jgi:hypothetical protein
MFFEAIVAKESVLDDGPIIGNLKCCSRALCGASNWKVRLRPLHEPSTDFGASSGIGEIMNKPGSLMSRSDKGRCCGISNAKSPLKLSKEPSDNFDRVRGRGEVSFGS